MNWMKLSRQDSTVEFVGKGGYCANEYQTLARIVAVTSFFYFFRYLT